MNTFYKYIVRNAFTAMLTFLSLAFVACGGDDTDEDAGGGNPGGGGSASVNPNNTNANVVDDSGSSDRAILRTEFPALHKEGHQKVLVYRTSSSAYDADGVNFSVEWDCDKRSQRWTCYQLHKGFSGKYSRVGDFYFDTKNLTTNEYYGEYLFFPHYQRGHICPSADRTASSDLNSQTFVMTNMQPQYATFNGYSGDNSGLWLRMENIVHSWATSLSASDTIFVCKGGTIDDDANIIERIGGKLIVPRYFFMAVLRKSSFGYAGMAFWSEQTNTWRSNETLLSHAMSIDELEKLTGIDFFCNLPDDVERQVEKTFVPSVWKDLDKK